MHRIEIRVTEDELNRIDQACGLIPRATFIKALILSQPILGGTPQVATSSVPAVKLGPVAAAFQAMEN